MTPTDAELIRLAALTWHSRGALEQAVRVHSLSPAQFWFRVAALVESEAALAAMPVEVSRLRRVRDARLRQRRAA